MEDQAEKMEALKKAYAEIILNTEKEAAARVMVSERKALVFQHDLRDTKQEALQMLLRLKHMIDAKTTEAEMTTLNRQKRIEELDAQLDEAEGVIVDLRAELRKAYDQLEEVNNGHMLHSNGPSDNECLCHFENTAHDKRLDITEEFRSSSQRGRCCNPAKETATSGPHLHNLASMIIGSKEPELYTNAYTHRIRAIERNLVDEKNISEDKPAQDICTKKELIINVKEKNSGKCAPSIENTDTNTDTKNISGSEALSTSSSVAKDQPSKAQGLTRNSIRYAKSNPKLSQFCHGQSGKPTTEPEKVNLNESSLEKDQKSTENNEQSACTLRRSIRKRKVRCWDDISSLFKSRAAPSRCKKYSGNDGVKFDEHQYKSKSVTEMNQIIVPISPATNASEETKDDESPAHRPINVVEDTKLINESMVEKHEVAAKESAGVSNCNFVTEADKVLPSGAACDTEKNRLLKYTFSRKRKKDLLSKSENFSSLGKSISTGKMGEKPGFSPEKEKPNLDRRPPWQ